MGERMSFNSGFYGCHFSSLFILHVNLFNVDIFTLRLLTKIVKAKPKVN